MTQQTTDLKGWTETWERAASAWFDTWMKSPTFVSTMGRMLGAQLGLKGGANRMVDDTLEMWRIPSGRDLEALAQRIATLEDRIATLEAERANPHPAPAASEMSGSEGSR